MNALRYQPNRNNTDRRAVQCPVAPWHCLAIALCLLACEEAQSG